MSKISNSSPHHSPHHTPENQSAKGSDTDKASSHEESHSRQGDNGARSGGKFENLKPVSTLIDAALHSKHLLSKKLDDRISKNNERSGHGGDEASHRAAGSNTGGKKFEGLKTVSTLIDGALNSKHSSSPKSESHVPKSHDNNHDSSPHQDSSNQANSPHQTSEPRHTTNNGRNIRQSDSTHEGKLQHTGNFEIHHGKSEDRTQVLSGNESKDYHSAERSGVLKNSDGNNRKGETRSEAQPLRSNDNSAHHNSEASAHHNQEAFVSHNQEASLRENHQAAASQNCEVSIDISDLTTVLQALKRGLTKHAADAGLPIHEQDKFAQKLLKNFADQAQTKGSEKLLAKAGDFSLLNSGSLPFKAKITGNQFQLILGEKAIADLRQIKQQSQTNLQVRENHIGNFTSSNSNNVGAQDVETQRMSIEARLPLPVASSREFALLKAAIQNKVDEILQQLGLSGEQNEKAFPGGSAKTTEDLLLAFDLLGGKLSASGGDKVLFAAALGVGTNAADEPKGVSGSGILAQLLSRSDELGANNQLNLIALARVLQHGSQAGLVALLKSANADFSPVEIKGLAQLHEKLGTVIVTHLAIGIVTMGVMTREVVENLRHVADNAAVGLSDNALAALQKAQNSLRDHLTATDLIGAIGDLKQTPIDIGGSHYNFLPEVKEALNSLREARSRILSETMYLNSNAAGIESQQRFSREAEVLLGITQRLESLLNLG